MKQLLTCSTMAAALLLTACSSNDDSENVAGSNELSQSDVTADVGPADRDTSGIAGLWDGSRASGEAIDVVYWSVSPNGFLTRFDYQQDGLESANGENCYIIDEPLEVTPIEGDVFTFSEIPANAVVSDDTLTITFMEPDANDMDANGDFTETPTFSWDLLTTASITDLNSCITSVPEGPDTRPTSDEPASGDDASIPQGADEPVTGSDGGDSEILTPADLDPNNNNLADRPTLTPEQCEAAGGTTYADPGDGSILRPEYRCESGLEPIGNVVVIFPEDGPQPVESGAVCCI